MDREVTCPYCKEDVMISTDDGAHYHENGEEDQCSNCDKYFMVYSSFEWSSEAKKADCLNGEPHGWSDWSWHWKGSEGKPNEGKHYERRYCSDCGEDEWEWHDEPLDPRGARL